MHRKISYLLAIAMFLAIVSVVSSQDETEPAILFDDFSYTAQDDSALLENGWIVREGDGWPGVQGATWRADNITFIEDPENEENQLMVFTSSVDGDDVFQTQICHQRKYYEGTYASRVFFTNDPVTGRDGDNVVQTFYLISTPKLEGKPDYSEMDYEYLPNGGWGFGESTFFATSWKTYRLEPWFADNESGIEQDGFAGWHVLVIQVGDEEISYHVDGEHFATHDEYFYPEVPLSINFNLWFIDGGLLGSSGLREYTEQIDWVFHAQNEILSPDEVLERVDVLRDEDISFVDTAPAQLIDT